MKLKSRKSALILSCLSLMLCFAMLIGSTFAWFTDTATTGVNRIQSGTLKIELYKEKANGEWEKLTDGSDALDWVKAAESTETTILWEPGCTYKLPKLKIVNEGNLALKYQITVNGATGNTELLDVIKFTSTVTNGTDVVTKDGTAYGGVIAEGSLLTANSEAMIEIQGHMEKSAGNTYQGMELNGIAIKVAATQKDAEYDSFDNIYDQDATYADVVYVKPTTTAEMNEALQQATSADGNPAKAVKVELPANTNVTLDSGIVNSNGSDNKGRTVTFVGDGTQTVDIIENAVNGSEGTGMNYQRGSSFTFENLTIQAGTGDFNGIVCDKLTFKNCTINGRQALYANDVEFVECKFDSGTNYALWTYGAKNVTFTKCSFESGDNSKSVLCYSVLSGQTFTRTFNNCTFTANGTADKSAIMINPTESGGGTNTYIVNINNCTATGYKENGISGQTLVGLRNAGAGVIDTITVNVNGSTVYTH